jgi:hypothetical protein
LAFFDATIFYNARIFLIWLRQMFYNRDDATARRFIWLRQMRDVKRRIGVRSTLTVAPSRLQKAAMLLKKLFSSKL